MLPTERSSDAPPSEKEEGKEKKMMIKTEMERTHKSEKRKKVFFVKSNQFTDLCNCMEQH